MRCVSRIEVSFSHAPSSPRFLRGDLPPAGGLHREHQHHRLPAQESPAALQPDHFLVRRLYDEFPGLLAHQNPDVELPQRVLTRKPNLDQLTSGQKKRGPDSRGAPGRGPSHRDRSGRIGGDRVPALGVAIASPSSVASSSRCEVTRQVAEIPARTRMNFPSCSTALSDEAEIITQPGTCRRPA